MSLLLSPMLWRAIAAAAILAGLAWGYHLWADHQREIGRQEIRVEWQADKLARSEANQKLVAANAKTSSDLQAAADKERRELYAKNRSIDLELAESLKRLRNRPERPADSGERVPEVADAGAAGPGNAGCTGAGLFRDDSALLIRLASDADRLRTALQSCRAAYERAEALNAN